MKIETILNLHDAGLTLEEIKKISTVLEAATTAPTPEQPPSPTPTPTPAQVTEPETTPEWAKELMNRLTLSNIMTAQQNRKVESADDVLAQIIEP